MLDSERPRLPIRWLPTSPLEWLVELAALAGVLFWFYYLTAHQDSLPDTVPSGFSFKGRPRASTASFPMLWLFPCLGLVSYVILTVLARFTQLHNIPTEVTPNNAQRVYGMSRWVLQLTKLQVLVASAYIEWKMIETGRGSAEGLGAWFAPTLLAVVFATSLVPMMLLRRESAE